MRNRSLCLPLFATLVLLPQAAAATPITISYSGTYHDEAGISVSNNTYLSGPNIYVDDVVIHLPKFNPALGTLLSAQLTVTGGMSAVMVNHAELYIPGAVVSTAQATVSTVLIANGNLLALLGGNAIMGVDFSAQSIGDGSDGIFDTPAVASQRTRTDTYFFQNTYTGAGLQSFMAASTADNFSLAQGGQSTFAFTGTHSGFPDNDMLDFQQRAGTAPGISTTNPVSAGTLVSLSLLALQILNLEVEHGGLLGYSDFHLEGAAVYGMNVSYTYEPAVAAVPEPGTLALLGAGLLVIARAVRRGRLP
jgi:hypothetical protein